jgi:hypothetical protein
LVTAQVGGRRYGKQQEGLLFFKKKQKTPAQLASAFPQRLSLNLSKFFGSFFQKRTASRLLPFLGARRSGGV